MVSGRGASVTGPPATALRPPEAVGDSNTGILRYAGPTAADPGRGGVLHQLAAQAHQVGAVAQGQGPGRDQCGVLAQAMPGQCDRRRAALSPSRAKDFMQCPLMFRLRTVDRLPEPGSLATHKGTVVHGVLERLYDLPASERLPEAALELLPSQWASHREKNPEVMDLFEDADQVETWLEEARGLIRTYFTLENPQRLEPAERELYVEVPVEREGEQGQRRQPRHPYADALATLLLTRGAHPVDQQTLYNRMFRPDDAHLERLEQVTGIHLARFGAKEGLVVSWNRQDGAPGTTQGPLTPEDLERMRAEREARQASS